MAARCALGLAIAVIACGDDKPSVPKVPPAPIAKPAPAAQPPRVMGTVIDRDTGRPVGDVQVVLRRNQRELTVTAKADGTFEQQVPAGTYYAYVRDPNYLSVGLIERVRLDNAPRAELADAIDETITPAIDVTRDIAGLELTVARAARLSGRVHDRDDKPIVGAVMRLRMLLPDTVSGITSLPRATRPVLGTDSAETDDEGRFTLVVPAGKHVLDASHEDFAGLGSVFAEVELDAGEKLEVTLPLERGCIITGKVVDATGAPVNDGAIERLGGARRNGGFGPSGRVEGGRFRWSTTEQTSITLRAWPWKQPPSQAKTFECRSGKRFDDVVLRLPAQRADVSGVVIDTNDKPVPLAHVDVQPLGPLDSGQQERADSAGAWHVYDLSAGRYRVTASVPGLGVADSIVVAPRHDVRLRLSGTGRIAGTTTSLDSGTLEVALLHCGPKDQPQQIAHEPRIVRVEGGRFTIDRVPACTLTFSVRWRDRVIEQTAVVEPDRATHVAVDVGPPRAKQVSGVVRDASGNAVEGARVTAVLNERESATARTDGDGRYTLQTHAGAQVVAGKGERVGRGVVGRANVPAEQLDITLDGSGL